MKVDPRHLSQLSAIVEKGSFQEASEALGLTQPALSRNMRILEERLGVALFDRSGKRSIPTKIGRRLARNGLAIRIAEDQASTLAEMATRGQAGKLRIGAPPILAATQFLTPTLSEIIRESSEIQVDLVVGLVPDLLDSLTRGALDLVIGPRSLTEPAAELHFEQLIDDRVGILCRAGHPLTKLGKVEAEDFMKQSWLAHSPGSVLQQQTVAALLDIGVTTIDIQCEAGSINATLDIVANTDLLTAMPRISSTPHLGDQLVFLPFDHPILHRPIGVIRRLDTNHSPLAGKLLRSLRNNVKDT